MEEIDKKLMGEFSCPKCGHLGSQVEHLAMSGTGLSRFADIQHHEYVFVSCASCGYTEVYNLKTLRKKIG